MVVLQISLIISGNLYKKYKCTSKNTKNIYKDTFRWFAQQIIQQEILRLPIMLKKKFNKTTYFQNKNKPLTCLLVAFFVILSV